MSIWWYTHNLNMKKNNELLVLICLVLISGIIFLSNAGLDKVSANNVLGTGVNVTESTANENIAVLDYSEDILTLSQEINTTTKNIYINVSSIYVNVSNIYARVYNCTPYTASEVGGMCWYLDQINDTLGSIQASQNLTAVEIWNYSMANLTTRGFAADSTIMTLFDINTP